MMSTHGPIQKDLIEPMNKIGRLLGKAFKPYGFALLVFPIGSDPDGRMNYISNARRKDMIIAMKEFIARCEGMDIEMPETRQ